MLVRCLLLLGQQWLRVQSQTGREPPGRVSNGGLCISPTPAHASARRGGRVLEDAHGMRWLGESHRAPCHGPGVTMPDMGRGWCMPGSDARKSQSARDMSDGPFLSHASHDETTPWEPTLQMIGGDVPPPRAKAGMVCSGMGWGTLWPWPKWGTVTAPMEWDVSWGCSGTWVGTPGPSQTRQEGMGGVGCAWLALMTVCRPSLNGTCVIDPL